MLWPSINPPLASPYLNIVPSICSSVYWTSISLILYGAGCFYSSCKSSNVYNPSLGKPIVTCSGTAYIIKDIK